MSIFECSKCHCVENTACCGYNYRGDNPALCSECDPAFGKWHGIFEKKSAVGYLLGNDGFLYHKSDRKSLKWREEHQGFKILKEVRRLR